MFSFDGHVAAGELAARDSTDRAHVLGIVYFVFFKKKLGPRCILERP